MRHMILYVLSEFDELLGTKYFQGLNFTISISTKLMFQAYLNVYRYLPRIGTQYLPSSKIIYFGHCYSLITASFPRRIGRGSMVSEATEYLCGP